MCAALLAGKGRLPSPHLLSNTDLTTSTLFQLADLDKTPIPEHQSILNHSVRARGTQGAQDRLEVSSVQAQTTEPTGPGTHLFLSSCQGLLGSWCH